MLSNDVANKEVSAIRAALSDRISRNECTPKKRSLGNIVLYPSAFQCPWADRLACGEICSDGVTINTEDGDTFESVHHWVQAEQRREMTSILKESRIEAVEVKAAPGTPAPFGFNYGQDNNNTDNLNVQRALNAFHNILQSGQWDDEEVGKQGGVKKKHQIGDDDDDDLYDFDDDGEEGAYQGFQSQLQPPLVRVGSY